MSIHDKVLLRSTAHPPWNIANIRDDTPGQSQCDVLVADKSVAVIPEVVFGVHAPVVQQSVLASQNDLVPQNYLMDGLSPALYKHQ